MPASPKLDWIFLDLDNTLWDFDANAEEALQVLFERHHLKVKSGYEVHEFCELYKSVNATFWKRYENGEIDKHHLRTERFVETFRQMGIPESEHPEDVWNEYLEICPLMTRMMPGAMEFLQKASKNAKLAIITNGFEHTQVKKLSCSGIEKYISFMVTSETFGIPKPNKEIFQFALEAAKTTSEHSLYIGDTFETDILGAIGAGIPVAWVKSHDHENPADATSHALFRGHFYSLFECMTELSKIHKWV